MKATKKIQTAWAMYDWANSTYNLVIGTAIFPIFYSAVTKDDADGASGDNVLFFGHVFINTEVLSYCLAFGMAMVCFLAPTLAGIADYLGRKKLFMRIFCYLGAGSCASLFFFDVAHLEWSMLSVVLACIGFWCSYAFSNSFLPELAEPEEQDKLSAKGYSFGYVGSVILLILNLVMIQVFEMPAKYCFITVGLWWIGFAHYTFYHLTEKKKDTKFDWHIIGNGFKELKMVWQELKNTQRLKRYLLAFFVFSMGVQTIMQMAAFFGEKEVQWTDNMGILHHGLKQSHLIGAILLVQIIAIPGAIFFSKLSNRKGNLFTLKAALIVWICVCSFAYFLVHSPLSFYIDRKSVV